MTDMLDDPAAMTSSQRRREIATILARGVLRLRPCREKTPGSQPFDSAEKIFAVRQDCLDEGAKTIPHGPAG